MYFKQFYLGCLAHASYLVGSDGEAAVVDPQRDEVIHALEIHLLFLQLEMNAVQALDAAIDLGDRNLGFVQLGAQVFGEVMDGSPSSDVPMGIVACCGWLDARRRGIAAHHVLPML